MGTFDIKIIGLPRQEHHYSYSFGREFFDLYGKDLIENGMFEALVLLDVKDMFINARVQIDGKTTLTCDRTSEDFTHTMSIKKNIVFKYGEEEKEISEDVVTIPLGKEVIDMGRYMYEFIALSIPAKKLHPDVRDNNYQDEVVYSSEGQPEQRVDPRWEALKSLNKNN